jgi:hypothetical protein
MARNTHWCVTSRIWCASATIDSGLTPLVADSGCRPYRTQGVHAAAFGDAGTRYETSPRAKSALYLEALPAFNRGAVAIPNHHTLLRELRGLERRVHRSGRDSVDHPAHGSDDFANAVCGALYIAFHEMRRPRTRMGTIDFAGSGRVSWRDDGPKEHSRVRIVRINEQEDLRQRGLR